MIKWFAANNFVINFDKTNRMKFITKNSSHYTLHIDYKEKHTQFLGLQTDNHINCKNITGQIISKLSGACQWHTQMNLLCILSFFYKIWNNFLGRLPFQQWECFSQKQIIRIMAGVQPRTSCRSLFKQLEILLIPFQYTLSLTNFTPSIIRKCSKHLHLYGILIQGISIIFVDQMPT